MKRDEGFVLREARLLDEQRYAEWLDALRRRRDVLDPDAADQASPQRGAVDHLRAEEPARLRVERLSRGEMHVQSPPSRTVHHVSAVEVDGDEARSALIVAEWRAGEAAGSPRVSRTS
jgi:3-phenylpropionate/cinnamic acid dioxygenase small subunit